MTVFKRGRKKEEEEGGRDRKEKEGNKFQVVPRQAHCACEISERISIIFYFLHTEII